MLFIIRNVKAKHFSPEIYDMIMDIPVASSFDELQNIFDHLKQSNEPKIHGICLQHFIVIL